jgi:hypothetical protein
VRRDVQARGALVGAANEDLRDVRVALAAELARTYFELRGAQERLGVARRNAENQRRTLEVTQQRLDAGRGTAFDTERARTQLGFTLASIPDLEARVASAQYQIGVLVGRPPATLADELAAAAPLPALPASVAVASPDSLIRRRPDVSAAERQVAAERAFVGAAKAEYLPRITVGGSAGYSATALDGPGRAPAAAGPVLRTRAQPGRGGAGGREAPRASRRKRGTNGAPAPQEVETALGAFGPPASGSSGSRTPRRRARGRAGTLRPRAAWRTPGAGRQRTQLTPRISSRRRAPTRPSYAALFGRSAWRRPVAETRGWARPMRAVRAVAESPEEVKGIPELRPSLLKVTRFSPNTSEVGGVVRPPRPPGSAAGEAEKEDERERQTIVSRNRARRPPAQGG